METRQYVNYFSEIETYSEAQQLDLLEQARHQCYIVENRQLGNEFSQTSAYFVTIVIALVPPYLLGFDITINAACLGIGLIVSGFLSDWLDKRGQGKVLHEGLMTILHKREQASGVSEPAPEQTSVR